MTAMTRIFATILAGALMLFWLSIGVAAAAIIDNNSISSVVSLQAPNDGLDDVDGSSALIGALFTFLGTIGASAAVGARSLRTSRESETERNRQSSNMSSIKLQDALAECIRSVDAYYISRSQQGHTAGEMATLEQAARSAFVQLEVRLAGGRMGPSIAEMRKSQQRMFRARSDPEAEEHYEQFREAASVLAVELSRNKDTAKPERRRGRDRTAT